MSPVGQQDAPAEQPDPQLQLPGASWGNKHRHQPAVPPTAQGSSARQREKGFLKEGALILSRFLLSLAPLGNLQ